LPCSSFPPQPNSPTQMVCYTAYVPGSPDRGQPNHPWFPRKQRAPDPEAQFAVPEYSPRGAKPSYPTRKALEYDLTGCHPCGWRARGPFVRYSISKAMSKVVVFQGRARPSHLCYTFRITSLLCLESSSTIDIPDFTQGIYSLGRTVGGRRGPKPLLTR
jgi:hypothetical protein